MSGPGPCQTRSPPRSAKDTLWCLLTDPYHYCIAPWLVVLAAWPSLAVELIRNGTWTSPFDFSSPVFPVTYGTSLVVFLLLVRIGGPRVGWGVAAFYGFGTVVGSIGLFELVLDEFFPNTDYLFKFVMFTFALSGLVSVRRWAVRGWIAPMVVAWILVFFVWVFVDPTLPTSDTDATPLLLNAITKVGSLVVCSTPLALGFLRTPVVTESDRADRSGPPSAT